MMLTTAPNLLRTCALALPLLFLAACDGESASPQSTASAPALEGTYWRLVELNGNAVTPSRNEAHIVLDAEEHRVSGSGGCNRLMGAYHRSGEEDIAFGKMASTMMACADGMETEHVFHEVLGEKVKHFGFADGKLELRDEAQTTVAVFEAVEQPSAAAPAPAPADEPAPAEEEGSIVTPGVAE